MTEQEYFKYINSLKDAIIYQNNKLKHPKRQIFKSYFYTSIIKDCYINNYDKKQLAIDVSTGITKLYDFNKSYKVEYVLDKKIIIFRNIINIPIYGEQESIVFINNLKNIDTSAIDRLLNLI